MNELPYKIESPDVVSVCGWCFPGEKIIEKFPELSGKRINHGICPAHRDALLKGLKQGPENN